ncbi:MAG: glycosyltransferase [Actinomycetota bacterium]|nr:MAG: glycosyltransferase [Actinomycetota bacterium]
MRPTGALAVRTVVAAAAAAAIAGAIHSGINARLLRRPRQNPEPVQEKVSVLIPARNEAATIGPCVAALQQQTGLPYAEFLVLDDASRDDTAAVVAALAAADPRVRLLSGVASEPPAGWLGKPWACQQLGDAATGSVLVFLDADVVVAPHGVAATVDLLRRNRYALVSPYPRQLADSWLERLVQPLLCWSWLTTVPLRWAERSPRPSLAVANGQLLAVDAAAYRRAGGHAAIRGEVLDDIALLRRVLATGGRGSVADGSTIARCRMYVGARALVDGYAKSLWAAGGSPGRSAAIVALLLGCYVVPPAAAILSPDTATRLLGATGYAAGVASRVICGRRTGSRCWPDALAHPVSISCLAALSWLSYQRHRRGSLTWKDRRLP